MTYSTIHEASDVHVYKANNGRQDFWRIRTKDGERDIITIRGLRERLHEMRDNGVKVPTATMERIDREIAMENARMEAE